MRVRGTTSAPIAATAAVQHALRRRLRLHLYDESGVTPAGTEMAGSPVAEIR